MKVQVKDKQGIDEAGNKHPAPGIADGTHECELKDEWQNPYTHDKRWEDEPSEAYHQHSLSHGFATRQAWRVLAEQEKEEVKPFQFESPYGRVLYKNIASSKGTIRQECENIYKAMHEYAEKQSVVKSTRIAELEARVAELEGVLKKIQDAYCGDDYINGLATNAIKNKY